MARKLGDRIYELALRNSLIHNGKANPGSVLGSLISEDPKIKSEIGKVKTEIDKIVSRVNKMNMEEQKKEALKLDVSLEVEAKEERGLPDLPNASPGKVIMRLAPYPSGPLHIGNSRTFIINDEYVKKYGGKIFLVIDDTIGSSEKLVVKEAYDLIPEGLEWLGIKFGSTYYKSDRLDIYYKYAEEIIRKGHAYVCECNAQEMRKNRAKGLECVHRKQPVEENLEKWKKMLGPDGYKEGGAVVRLRTDMNHPNPAFRDRVLLRICDREHPRVGKKYRVWPLLEFSWAVDDHLLGITHILRGKDLMMESKMEEFLWKIFGWEPCEFLYTGLARIEGVKLSKSKAQKEVESGEYSGWDDPRTWSLQSLRRRGFRPGAIRAFSIHLGMSLSDVTVPVDSLYSENRRIIDPEANRYFFVDKPVEITLDKKFSEALAPLHPDDPGRGKRRIPVGRKIFVERRDFEKLEGKEVRLLHLCNVILGKKSRVTSTEVKPIPKIHWVSRENVPVKVVMPDASEREGLAEPDFEKTKKGDIVQMERFGFCRVDLKEPLTCYFTHK